MSFRLHASAFDDEIFDIGSASTSTPTTSFIAGKDHSILSEQQQTPLSAKCMISLQNNSDEYYTANDSSFNNTQNISMNQSIIQQNIAAQGRQTGIMTGMTSTTLPTTMAARKQMLPVEPTEPAKPLSAYALFFRDTVSAIKQQNPTCSFQELSKIVASMWDVLDQTDKGVYNKRNEVARMEYLKQMKIYQQHQQEKQEQLNTSVVSDNDTNGQQQTTTQPVTQTLPNNISVQQNTTQVNNNLATNNNTPTAPVGGNTTERSNEPSPLSNAPAGAGEKCLRENCNKRAIISPDWEDEYCSNECVVIHCRNVFNDWVQSNLDARQQEQQQEVNNI